ncbi:TPA: hypothetical protein ACPHLE_004261, partial [Enterobacter cloacae]
KKKPAGQLVFNRLEGSSLLCIPVDVLGTSPGNTEITIPDGHLLLNTDCSVNFDAIQAVFPRKMPRRIGLNAKNSQLRT